MSVSCLVESVLSSFVALDGFSVVRGDVCGFTRKHGVCLYAKNSKRLVEVNVCCPNVAAFI